MFCTKNDLAYKYLQNSKPKFYHLLSLQSHFKIQNDIFVNLGLGLSGRIWNLTFESLDSSNSSSQFGKFRVSRQSLIAFWFFKDSANAPPTTRTSRLCSNTTGCWENFTEMKKSKKKLEKPEEEIRNISSNMIPVKKYPKEKKYHKMKQCFILV